MIEDRSLSTLDDISAGGVTDKDNKYRFGQVENVWRRSSLRRSLTDIHSSRFMYSLISCLKADAIFSVSKDVGLRMVTFRRSMALRTHRDTAQ